MRLRTSRQRTRADAQGEVPCVSRGRSLMSGGALWQALGWVALALNVWGNLELTGKSTRGWIVRLACNACWLPYSAVTGAWALLANHALFALINVYGWRKWSR